MNLPRHISLDIGHNDFATTYESPEEWVGNRGDTGPHWANTEQKTRAIDTRSIWTIHWFPDTPNGSIYLAAPTLTELLSFAQEVEKVSV